MCGVYCMQTLVGFVDWYLYYNIIFLRICIGKIIRSTDSYQRMEGEFPESLSVLISIYNALVLAL